MSRTVQKQAAVENRVSLKGLSRADGFREPAGRREAPKIASFLPAKEGPTAPHRGPMIIYANVIKFNGCFIVSILYFPCSSQCCWIHPRSHQTPSLGCWDLLVFFSSMFWFYLLDHLLKELLEA